MIAAGDLVHAPSIPVSLDRLSVGAETVALTPSRGGADLRLLASRLDRLMRAQGVPLRERWRFNPHMTLMYRDQRTPSACTAPIEPICWQDREFVLIHSLVGETRHRLLGRWPLDAPPPQLAFDLGAAPLARFDQRFGGSATARG